MSQVAMESWTVEWETKLASQSLVAVVVAAHCCCCLVLVEGLTGAVAAVALELVAGGGSGKQRHPRWEDRVPLQRDCFVLMRRSRLVAQASSVFPRELQRATILATRRYSRERPQRESASDHSSPESPLPGARLGAGAGLVPLDARCSERSSATACNH